MIEGRFFKNSILTEDGDLYRERSGIFSLTKPKPSARGYTQAWFKDPSGGPTKLYQIHRAVAEAFIPNTNNLPMINHKNGLKSDNRVVNLEWSNASNNVLHSYHTLGNIKSRRRGQTHYETVLSNRQVGLLKLLHSIGVSGKALGDLIGIQHQIIYRTLRGVTHGNVPRVKKETIRIKSGHRCQSCSNLNIGE